MQATYCRNCGQLIPVADRVAGPVACARCHALISGLPRGDSGPTARAGWDEAPINPYASPGESQRGDAPIDTGLLPRNSLVWIALALPVITPIATCLAGSALLAIALPFVSVVVTSILIYIDAKRLGRVDRHGVERTSPGGLLIGGVLLWIVFYPLAFFQRRHFCGPNLGPPSLLVAALFLFLPIGVALMVPKDLPACDSPEVTQMLLQIVGDSPDFKQGTKHLRHIDGHRETRFDAEKQIRTGACTLRTDTESVPLTFTVTWQDRDKAMFFVKILKE